MRALHSFIVVIVLGLLIAVPAAEGARGRVVSGDVLAERAAKLVQARRYDEAIAVYQSALKHGAGHFAVFELAQAHRLAGHHDEAVANYRLFLRLAPRSPLRFEVKVALARLARRVVRRPVEPRETAATPTPTPVIATVPAPPTPVVVEPVPVVVRVEAPPESPAIASLGQLPAKAPVESAPKEPARVLPAPAPVMVFPPPVAPIVVSAAPVVPVEPLLRPVPLDAGELSGGVLIVTGAVATGIAIALGIGAHQQAEEIDDSVRFDPAIEATGQRYGTAALSMGIVGVVALAAGGAVFGLHHERAHKPATTIAPAARGGALSRSY